MRANAEPWWAGRAPGTVSTGRARRTAIGIRSMRANAEPWWAGRAPGTVSTGRARRTAIGIRSMRANAEPWWAGRAPGTVSTGRARRTAIGIRSMRANAEPWWAGRAPGTVSTGRARRTAIGIRSMRANAEPWWAGRAPGTVSVPRGGRDSWDGPVRGLGASPAHRLLTRRRSPRSPRRSTKTHPDECRRATRSATSAASRGDGPALRNVQHGARQRHLLGRQRTTRRADQRHGGRSGIYPE